MQPQNGSGSTRRKRVLIVDAHPIVRHGLARLFAEEPDLEVVASAGTPEDAVRAAGQATPDAVVIEPVFPEGGGLDLLKRLRAACGGAAILVVSAQPPGLYGERVLRAGANGFISKHSGTAELLSALRAVLDGATPVLEGGAASELTAGTRRLTDREVQVLELIGKGLRSREIAESMGLSEKTIEGYRAQLRDKLSLPDAASLLQHAIKWVRLS